MVRFSLERSYNIGWQPNALEPTHYDDADCVLQCQCPNEKTSRNESYHTDSAIDTHAVQIFRIRVVSVANVSCAVS
eukprot:m.1197385 g.1197385  ORF g.1197385 m.1197385 type:complete len:76 (-) comp24567_c0_seq1:236-463(-)